MFLINIATNLYSLGLIDRAAQREITDRVESDEITSRSQLLHDLVRYRSGSPSGFFVAVRSEPTPRGDLQILVQQLRESEAISDRVYEWLWEKITTPTIKFTIQFDTALLQVAALRIELDEYLQLANIEPFANQLRAQGVLSDTKYAQLLHDLHNEGISEPIALLHYIDRARLFNLKDYSLDPYDYFPKIHQAIAQMLTETGVATITLENFHLELAVEERVGQRADGSRRVLVIGNAIVSVQVDGTLYQQVSEYSSFPDEPDWLTGRISSREIVQLFNKILRDRASLYRLCSIAVTRYDTPIRSIDDARLGVIALTREQAVYTQLWGFSPTYPGEDETLTSDRITTLLNLFERIGLFSHLTEAQIASGRERVAQRSIRHVYELLQAFDQVLVTFTREIDGLTNPYQYLTRRFVAASRGALTPTHISNEFDPYTQTAGQSFILNGIRYHATFDYDGKWLDPAFVRIVSELDSIPGAVDRVMITAQAKVEGLSSFTGAVFAIQGKTGGPITFPFICETDQASMLPPDMPTLPTQGGRAQCPPGSYCVYPD
jgi:hypothetical protein